MSEPTFTEGKVVAYLFTGNGACTQKPMELMEDIEGYYEEFIDFKAEKVFTAPSILLGIYAGDIHEETGNLARGTFMALTGVDYPVSAGRAKGFRKTTNEDF